MPRLLAPTLLKAYLGVCRLQYKRCVEGADEKECDGCEEEWQECKRVNRHVKYDGSPGGRNPWDVTLCEDVASRKEREGRTEGW
jgi:hypothetical protein